MTTHLYNTLPPRLLCWVEFCNGNSIHFGTDPHSNSALSPGWLLNRKKLLMWASDSSSEKWSNSNYPTDYIKHLTKCLTQSRAQKMLTPQSAIWISLPTPFQTSSSFSYTLTASSAEHMQSLIAPIVYAFDWKKKITHWLVDCLLSLYWELLYTEYMKSWRIY